MKREKEIRFGWTSLIPRLPLASELKGYSSAKQVAEKLNISESHALKILSRLRKAGKVECVRAKNENGKILTMYQD